MLEDSTVTKATLRQVARTDRLAHLAWTLLRPRPHPEIDVRAVLEPEIYNLQNRISASARQSVQTDHFLNYAIYESRRFLVCEGRDILMTMHAKALAAPGFGFVDEFNVGGAGGLPRRLINLDVEWRKGCWWVKESDVQRVKGFSIPLCHYGVGTFGHFMLDALLQIFLFRDSLANGDAHLLHWPLPSMWMSPILDRCGVPMSSRREVSKTVALMERAGLSSALAGHGVYFPSSISLQFFDWLRAVFDAPRTAGKRRLYIRRSENFGRTLKNGSAVEALASTYGFEPISPEELPIEDQVRLFADAGVVLSMWGSGLTLAPLLSGSRRVVEIMPNNISDAWFSRQAAVHDLDYNPIIQPVDINGSIEVDLTVLENTLCNLMIEAKRRPMEEHTPDAH